MMHHKMDPEAKAIWLVALRSGQYTQCKAVLEESSNNCCCLGVLANALNIPKAVDLPSKNVMFDFTAFVGDDADVRQYSGCIPSDFKQLTDGAQSKLIDMNDCGTPFTEIADWIEANL